jgi:hypothetical protein
MMRWMLGLALALLLAGPVWAQKDTMRMGEKLDAVVLKGGADSTMTDLAVLGAAGVACGLGGYFAGRRRK